jgi:hypothetical protein
MYFFQFISSLAWKNQVKREIHFGKSLWVDSFAPAQIGGTIRPSLS